jgi:hypothetical protein
MHDENKKPPKPMIRLVAALQHYVVDPFTAIFLYNIQATPMYMKGEIWSIDLIF